MSFGGDGSGDSNSASPSSSFGAVNDSSIDSSGGSITGAQLDGSAGNSLNSSEGIVGGTPCSDDIGNYSNNNTYNGISLDGSAGSMLDSTVSSAAYSFNGYTNDNYNSTTTSLEQNTVDMSGFRNTEVTEPSLLGSAWNSLTQWANENVAQPFQTVLNTPIQALEGTSIANLLADNVPGMTKDEVENGLRAMGVTPTDVSLTTNMIGEDTDAFSNWSATTGVTSTTAVSSNVTDSIQPTNQFSSYVGGIDNRNVNTSSGIETSVPPDDNMASKVTQSIVQQAESEAIKFGIGYTIGQQLTNSTVGASVVGVVSNFIDNYTNFSSKITNGIMNSHYQAPSQSLPGGMPGGYNPNKNGK